MSLFRRVLRSQGPQSRPPFGGRPPGSSTDHADDEPDWRDYDTVAEAYRLAQEPRMALPVADLVGLTGIAPGARVLDVATGTGVGARAATQAHAGLVAGVDASFPMLLQAVRGDGDPHYVAGEAIDLPFRDDAFGVVLCTFALSHFKRYDTALFDLLRVLARDGRMGVATWGSGEDEFSRAWRGVTWEFAEREIMTDALKRAVPWEERFQDPVRLKDTLHEAGLRDILVERREYRFQMTIEEYLAGRETSATGRFLHQMLGDGPWQRLRARARQVFTERFPERFNDFRDVNLAVGRKP